MRTHCGSNIVSYDVACLWQNVAKFIQTKSTFGKHDHVSNVAALMCPCFAGPQVETQMISYVSMDGYVHHSTY